ncbi:hypothetical protein KGQ20_39820 [Catenulispora sp. NF23]|uniref:zinc finger domain-containing protein n=1 Tax=Catenulispora pinistramenti TaxID=2705254 RepID=UPI001BAD084D|nr:hypothetical protein [Catenulispora pinistramenti]MBS2538913.1 hypothetical protein [Catenulispora pinistramenti]
MPEMGRAEQDSTDPGSTAHLRVGERITLDEVAVQLSAVAVWLRQLARAAETPAVPVELADWIEAWERTAKELDRHVESVGTVAESVEGGARLAVAFLGGKPWGAEAAGQPRDDYGPAPVVLTVNQVWHLRHQAQMNPDEPTVAYREHIGPVEGFESKHAAERRAAERAEALRAATLATACPRCEAAPGASCRTNTGRLSEVFHKPRTATAEEAMGQ